MESYKAFFVFCVVALSQMPRTVLTQQAKCECGVFKYPTEETTKETPLVSKAPQFDFECNAEGITNCANMCIALAKASREEGPQKLCELIGNTAAPFQPSVYYRACNADVWTFAGIKPTLTVCCQNNQSVPCA